MKTQIDYKTKVAISVIVNAFKSDGTTIRALRVLKILKNHYDISLITRANNKRKLKGLEDVKVIIVKPDKTKLWNLKLIPVVIKNKLDVVYCSNDLFGFLTYYLLSKIYRYKIIFEAHSIVSEESIEKRCSIMRVKLDQIFERFVVKHADHVITLSENTFEFYKKYNENINLIPVFIDETIFVMNKELETKKYESEYKLIGLIGPFDIITNRYFLEFLYTNINQFDNMIKFIVIGKCDNRIENDKIIYTGYLESTQYYVDVLCSLDAVLVPSKIATLGPLNKIIEPMSCSLPVFTTPKGMVGLYHVEPGKDILVLEDGEITDKVNELIFDGELMRNIGRNARIVVEKYYGKKANEKKLIDTIEDLNANK